MTPHNNLPKAALWYAERGYYVFPLHNPIFDDAGNCTGCTCEEWKRTQPEYGPKFKCPNPGKCPRVKWREQSTTDPKQIGHWWGKPWRNVDVETGQVVWNYPNIGIDTGKSGILIVDEDSYKEGYAGDSLQLEKRTVTSLTGGGGSHLWYQRPEGKTYGNATGDLPDGIDIRCEGGYIVAPPSLHESGKRYRFLEGHSPREIGGSPLPPALAAILDAAQGRRASRVEFKEGLPPCPDLTQWRLSDDVLELIHEGVPKGERSEADYKVIMALVKGGASDDEIRGVFSHYAIGAKYEERGDKYLALTIGKARAWLEDHPFEQAAPVPLEELTAARAWVRGPLCLNYLRGKGLRRVAELVPLLDAIVEEAQRRRVWRIVTTIRDLADLSGMSKSSAQRRLARLAEVGLTSLQVGDYGTLVDLTGLINQVNLSGTDTHLCESVPLRLTSEGDFLAEHRCDDAFTTYPYGLAIRRRMAPTVLLQSLGASGLLLWPLLADGGGTAKELAEATGLTLAAVRGALKRYAQSGLLVSVRYGREAEYWLYSDAEEELERKRPEMATSGVGLLRARRNANDQATFAHRKLMSRMPLEPKQRDRLETRRDKADERVEAYGQALLNVGLDPFAKVGWRRTPRPFRKVDLGEVWASTCRPIYERWEEMVSLSHEERYRLLGFAGFEREEIDRARRMAGKVGRGPRHFVGVGEPLQAVAA